MPNLLHVLFVCLPSDAIATLSDTLRLGGYEIVAERLDDPQQLSEKLSAHFDIFLVDSLAQHPRLVEQIQSILTEKSLDIPVLVYSSAGDEEVIVVAMKAGAKDFISSQNPKRVVSSVKREMLSVQQRVAMNKQTQIDSLLQEIDGLMLHGWDVVPLVEKICEHVATLFGFPLVWMGGKREDETVNVVAASGLVDYLHKTTLHWQDNPLAAGPVGLAIKEKRPVVFTIDSPDSDAWRAVAEAYGIQSMLAVPMVAWNEIIGVLVMYSSRRNEFALASVKRYSVFANRLAITVLGAQEHQQFRLLNTAMSKATQAIFITKHDGTIVWFNQALSDISGYSSQEIMDCTPRMFSSNSHDKQFWDEMWRTILQGKVWSGDVLNRRKDGSAYSVFQSITPLYDEQGVITHFLGVQQDVSEKKELERKIEFLAYHDVLTGLPNRMLFNDRVQQAISHAKRDQAQFSLLFVDLDGFKEINDTYGHAAGDQLLKTVAERLRECVREGDTVSRLGGDEFMVLLRNIFVLEDLQNVAQKIIARIALPYDLGGVQAHVTASIGISR
ncbi:MAG: diguanylate cyclase, partial [Gallionella sp.]